MGIIVKNVEEDYKESCVGKYDKVCQVIRKVTSKTDQYIYVSGSRSYSYNFGLYSKDATKNKTLSNLTFNVGILSLSSFTTSSLKYSLLASVESASGNVKVNLWWKYNTETEKSYFEVEIQTSTLTTKYTSGEYTISSSYVWNYLTVNVSLGETTSVTGEFLDAEMTFTSDGGVLATNEFDVYDIGVFIDASDKSPMRGECFRIWHMVIKNDDVLLLDLPAMNENPYYDYATARNLTKVGSVGGFPSQNIRTGNLKS